MKLKIQQFTFNPFQENTYVVYAETGDAVIIDPGCYSREEQQLLVSFIEEKQLKVLALLNTHCHIDHILGNAFVLRTFDVELYAHELDLPTLKNGSYAASLYGIQGYEESPEPTRFVCDNEILTFGAIEFKVIFGPGHAPGHVAFYNAENAVLMGGDILFKGSFGRYDLPGGSLEILKKTITERIFTLPENTFVCSGHGPITTIGDEKYSNPILHY